MDDFTQMHVFFAVTTAAVIITTALCGGLVFALIRFFTVLTSIAKEVQGEAEEIRANLDDLREDMKAGFRLVPLFNFFTKSAKMTSKKRKTRTRAKKKETE